MQSEPFDTLRRTDKTAEFAISNTVRGEQLVLNPSGKLLRKVFIRGEQNKIPRCALGMTMRRSGALRKNLIMEEKYEAKH